MSPSNLIPILSIVNLLYDFTSASERNYMSTSENFMTSEGYPPYEFSRTGDYSRSVSERPSSFYSNSE
jgi:hypothetical protein